MNFVFLLVQTIYSDNLWIVLIAAKPVTHSQMILNLTYTLFVHLEGRYQVIDIITKPIFTTFFTKFKDKLKVECNLSLRGC